MNDIMTVSPATASFLGLRNNEVSRNILWGIVNSTRKTDEQKLFALDCLIIEQN